MDGRYGACHRRLSGRGARAAAANLGPAYAQGRHIAATACSECHGSDLRGDPREGGPDLVVVGAYDLDQFRRLLRTGAPPSGRDLGIMSETARKDLRVFTDAEIAALYAYLRARAATTSRLGPGR
jgi:mono/diheme cytochrome c family protein